MLMEGTSYKADKERLLQNAIDIRDFKGKILKVIYKLN